MKFTDQERGTITELASEQGIDSQVKLVQSLFNGDEKIVWPEKYGNIFEKLIDNASIRLQNIGIKQLTIDKIRMGQVCQLDNEEKTAILDTILVRIGADVIKQFNKGNNTFNYSGDELKHLNKITRAVYDDSKIQIVGNVVQILCLSDVGYTYFDRLLSRAKNSDGMSFRMPKEGAKPDEDGLLVNIIREVGDDNNRNKTKKHELWHAFDDLRFQLREISEPFSDRKHKIVDPQKLFDIYNALVNGMPNEFLDFVFGEKRKKNPLLLDFDRNLILLNSELSAFLAGCFESNESIRIDSRSIVNTLVTRYLLQITLDIDDLISNCILNDKGMFVVSTDKLLQKINPLAVRLGGLPPCEESYVEYFTEIEIGSFPTKRKFKPGMEEKVRQYYQRVVNAILNDDDSPINQVYAELQRAINAFQSRSFSVSPYRALVEMSMLPFNRWAAYVRLKEMRN